MNNEARTVRCNVNDGVSQLAVATLVLFVAIAIR